MRAVRDAARRGARGLDGLESANANLMGEVTLSWDDERTDRDAIVAGLARGGFHELAAV